MGEYGYGGGRVGSRRGWGGSAVISRHCKDTRGSTVNASTGQKHGNHAVVMDHGIENSFPFAPKFPAGSRLLHEPHACPASFEYLRYEKEACETTLSTCNLSQAQLFEAMQFFLQSQHNLKFFWGILKGVVFFQKRPPS